MREEAGNLWAVTADVRVITTNGTVKKGGNAVMGRGCAREAAERWPTLPVTLGYKLRHEGLLVHVLWDFSASHGQTSTQEGLVSFPVKHEFWQVADLELIRTSAAQLVALVNTWPTVRRVVMPAASVVRP